MQLRIATLVVSSLVPWNALGAPAAAQRAHANAAGGPPGAPALEREVEPFAQSMLRFPHGVQTFDALGVGRSVEAIEAWGTRALAPWLYSVRVADDVLGVRTDGARWLRVDDASAAEWHAALRTSPVHPPQARNYAWTLRLAVEHLSGAGPVRPALMSQHRGPRGYADVFGVELAADGAFLAVRGLGGDPRRARLCTWDGATAFGEWIRLELAVDFDGGRVSGRVNGGAPVHLPLALRRGTHVDDFLLVHHGEGPGNAATFLLDDVGVSFGAALCEELVSVDFELEDDFATPLVNGQDLSTPPEFGQLFAISSSGPNLGAAIFDSTPLGPNDPSQDRDLLVGLGNLVILQTDAVPAQTVPGRFDRPNDDEDGGTVAFAFTRPLEVLALDLVDIDPGAAQHAVVTLTDALGRARVYDVPGGFTEDRLVHGGPGFRTLDTTTLLPQPGFMAAATAVEDPGFDPQAVAQLAVTFGSSGALDGLELRVPCIRLDFESEDDGTPLVNGQDVSTPPEFGTHVSITSSGPNGGAAIFDSTPGGPNDPSQDRDLLVGQGNLLILQNDDAAISLVQTVPGIFDRPNDDDDGGAIVFTFPAPVQPRQLDLVDIDDGAPNSSLVVLRDAGGNQRTYTVPAGWTEDLVVDGPPGFRTLDLRALVPQPGFSAAATVSQDPGYDEDAVVEVRVLLGSSGAMDNFCFCP